MNRSGNRVWEGDGGLKEQVACSVCSLTGHDCNSSQYRALREGKRHSGRPQLPMRQGWLGPIQGEDDLN